MHLCDINKTMQVLVNTLSKTPSTKNNHFTPSAMEIYITQHYKTPILGSSYSYLLQALSNVLILLSFLLFPITTAIPISLQYLVQYILWWLPQQSSISAPCSYNTSVLGADHNQTSQSEQSILQATMIGLGKGMYRDLLQ